MTFQDEIASRVGDPPDDNKAREVAHKAGCSLPTVRRWARGVITPHPSMQKMILQALLEPI